VVQRDAQAKASEDSAVLPEPFLPKRDRGVEDRRIGFEQRAQRAALIKIDNYVRERLDASPLRAEDQDGLAILDQPPGRRQAEFALVAGEEAGSATLWRNPVRWRGSVRKRCTHGRSSPTRRFSRCGGRRPHHLPEPQPGRTPVILNQAAGAITPQPCGEVVELIAVGQDRREVHNSSFVRVRTAKESLDLHLVTDLAFIEADHVPFVEHEQTHVIEKQASSATIPP
jgi:hypothetical protein